jgi:hypothetical protein
LFAWAKNAVIFLKIHLKEEILDCGGRKKYACGLKIYIFLPDEDSAGGGWLSARTRRHGAWQGAGTWRQTAVMQWQTAGIRW